MLTVRYALNSDLDFWYTLDQHLPKEQFFDKVRNKCAYILLKDEEMIGILRYNLFWDEIPFCTLLFIKKKYQHLGYGKYLMAYWEDEMRQKEYAMLLTSTQVDESAQHFYRAIGYQDCGGLVINSSKFAQPMELFLVKEI